MGIAKQILTVVLVLILGIAAYFLYQQDFFKGSTNALELVSPDAIMVFETEEPIKAWNTLVTQPIWQRLSELPSLKNAQEQLLALDSLVGRSGNLDRSLRGNQMVVSLHPVGRDDFDLLFAFALSEDSDDGFIKDLENNLPDLSRLVTRSYSDVPIFEFQSANLERNLTYARINNVIVASFTSFLVEEAIRYSQNGSLPNFKNQYKELFEDLPSPTGLGVLRVTSLGLSKLIEGISKEGNLSMIQNFVDNNLAANLELRFAENKVLFEGKSFFRGGRKIDFNETSTINSEIFRNYISNRTAVFFQYWGKENLQSQHVKNDGFQARNTLKGDIEKNLFEKGFLDRLKGELGFMLLETSKNEPQDKILLIHSDQVEDQIHLLKEFNLGLEKIDLSLIPVDFYQNREIFMVSEQEFPAHLFDGKFLGFEDTYITGLENILVMANSSKAIKMFLEDVSSDNTWGKSIQQQPYLEGISGNSWFNFVVNVPRFWNSLVEVSSPDWEVFFQKYRPHLLSFDMLGLQLKEDEGSQLTNLQLGYSIGPIKAVQDIVLTESKSIRFDNSLIYGPKSIQNFNDNSHEYIVQDEMFNIFLLTSEGEVVFTEQLGGPVVSDVFQIDYYKNGKLQLLFATGENVYIIDRLGALLPGFPTNPSNEEITHLNLVDYSNTRDYRYFLATASGSLYLLNSDGKSLEGWSPKRVNGQLAIKPAHHRIAGVGDQMIAMGSNGELNLFNRRGEAQIGSPIRIGEGVDSDYIIIERGSAKDTRIVTITKDGEVVQVNFRGELTYRNQLLRPDRESSFRLIKDQNDDRYLFVIHEFNKITIMDSDYQVLFTSDISATEMEFQFFSFGADKNIIVMIDKSQEFTYLFNLEGELLNTLPISGKSAIDIKYSGSQNEYAIHAIQNNVFAEFKLPI